MDSTIEFGVFDHIEHVPGVPLDQLYRERLFQLEALDQAGFFAYHLAEHHTPAVHSMAPSQNVFLAAASQRTRRLRFGPGVYVLPLHHPLRLIEEVSMLDHLSDGRLEIGVGRGGVLEAYFWGQESDDETNQARRRRPHWEQDQVAPEWGWVWPAVVLALILLPVAVHGLWQRGQAGRVAALTLRRLRHIEG